MNFSRIALWLSCVVLILLLPACSSSQYHAETGMIFNTQYNIKYESPVPLTDKIEKELKAFDLSLNPFNPEAIISKVNRNEEVEVDEWFRTVFNKAQEVSAISGGAFDPTVAPLINLWGFGFENYDSITQEKIDSILFFVGYWKARIENNRILKDDPRTRFNFSAIAKGYACDVIAFLLAREGVENYLIEIGGEIASNGKSPRGVCWKVGINKPEDDRTGFNKSLENSTIRLCGKRGLATSGNYRNFRIIDGKKYGHTLDPHTGYPVEQSILSASIVAPDGMTADAYATVFMVLGVEAACQLAANIPGLEYYLIYEDETTGQRRHRYSDGLLPWLETRR